MEQLLNDAIGVTDGLGGKIVGMLSALIVTIMTVVKVVRWAAKTTETQVSDLANLILLELNRSTDSVTLKDYSREISTPEGVKIKKYWGTNPFSSWLEIIFKDQVVDMKLSKTERKIIRKHYFEAVARKIASIEAENERNFQSKVTASLNMAVKAVDSPAVWDGSLKQYVKRT